MLAALAACHRSGADASRAVESAAPVATAKAPPPVASTTAVASAKPSATPEAALPREWKRSRDDCEAVAVFEAGGEHGSVCVDDVEKLGLTVIDLSDTWTPRVFAPNPETGDASPYRTKYLRLANQRDTDLGLYGIQPSLSLLADRLGDEKRQACQAAVDRAPLAELSEAMKAADPKKAQALAGKSDAKPAVLAAQAQLVCDPSFAHS